MVGFKRSRLRQESEDLGVEAEAASSSLRRDHNGRKRQRLTPVPADSDDDASVVTGTQQSRQDASDSDLSDNEVAARVARMHHRTENVANRAAECGVIEEVQCKNFMCHANLTIRLGPLINFIIGHNGSGKSAVLTALQLCLGGKATSTNRGQSLKHFIKTGAEQATLTVKIKNQGETAYQPDTYGNSIIVERTFSRAGTSGFKIRREDGKVISTKKGDLDEVLDALTLMMDNPVNVLTQDMARQFLNSSDPGQKYKFFYQGTHLEQLDSDYRILEETLNESQAQLINLEESAKEAKNVYMDAEKKAQLAERAQTLTEQYNIYARQMVWLQVQDEEEKLAGIEEDLRKQEEMIEERRSMFERLEAGMEGFNKKRDEAAEAVADAKAESASKTEEHTSVKDQFSGIKEKLMESQSQRRDIQGEVLTAQKNVKRLKDQIEQERDKIASADNGRHAQKMEEIQSAEEELESLNEQIQQKSSQSRELDVAKSDIDAELVEVKDAYEQSQAAVRGSQQRIAFLESEKGDWTKAYSPKLQNLLNAIAQEKRFRDMPVGPLGRHVKLLKPKWADILEQQAGRALNAFAVTSKADQTLLSQLMQRTGYDGQIFVTSPRPLDTTSHEPPEQYDTWMRVLRFDNALARNCMIINQGIDKTLLEEDKEKATEMVSARIPNVLRIFAMNPVPDQNTGDRWGYVFTMTSGGGESNAPIYPWKGGTRMQTDTEAQVTSEREKLARLRSQLQGQETVYRETQNKAKKALQEIAKHKRDMKELNLLVQRQEVALQDLKDALEADTPQEQALERLEAELKDAQETQQMNENQYQDAVVERDRLNSEIKPLMKKLSDIQRDLDNADEQVKAAERDLHRIEDQRMAKLRETNRSQEAIGDAEQQKGRLERERDLQVKQVSQFTEEASNMSLRVPIDAGETVDSIEKKLERITREQARQREQLGGDRETLILNMLDAKAKYEKRQRERDDHEAVLLTLKQALDNRRTRWEKFRDLIVIRASTHFTYLLSNRNFRGDLKIEHEDRSLEIKVEPDAARKGGRGRQTKTLSGGEKSFSTICLLLALWEAMGSPVRCLDEFDVFMDQVNRDISMRMMIDAARASVGRQYVLITPQSMNNVQIKDDVKIHKMHDPERGQTTLSQFVGA